MSEMVNHPKHYNRGRIEVVEFLEDQFMGRPHEWMATKYLCRSDLKHPDKEIEDLEKAIWYIRRKIEILKAAKEGRKATRPNDMNPSFISATAVLNGEAPAWLQAFVKRAREMDAQIYHYPGEWIQVADDGASVFCPHPHQKDLQNVTGSILFVADKK